MRRAPVVAVLALVAVGCLAQPAREPAPMRATDFRPEQIRQPALFLRFTFSSGFDDQARQSQQSDYEGALLEGLNTRAVLVREIQILRGGDPKFDAGTALTTARGLGADHAIVVEVRAIKPAEPVFCRETRRPFRASATVWTQAVQVIRASDGATRLAVPARGELEVSDFDADCDNPRQSRRRPASEALADAASKLLTRIVGP